MSSPGPPKDPPVWGCDITHVPVSGMWHPKGHPGTTKSLWESYRNQQRPPRNFWEPSGTCSGPVGPSGICDLLDSHGDLLGTPVATWGGVGTFRHLLRSCVDPLGISWHRLGPPESPEGMMEPQVPSRSSRRRLCAMGQARTCPRGQRDPQGDTGGTLCVCGGSCDLFRCLWDQPNPSQCSGAAFGVRHPKKEAGQGSPKETKHQSSFGLGEEAQRDP